MYKRDKEIKYSSDFQEYKQIIKSKKDHYRKSFQNVSEKTTKLFHGSNGFRIKKYDIVGDTRKPRNSRTQLRLLLIIIR
jgi:hypothetical protein